MIRPDGRYAMRNSNQFCSFCLIFFLILLAGISGVQAQNVVIKADNTSGCVPMLVSFNASLDPGYTSYEWSFDQGSTINNLLAPKKTFDVPKTYHVTFTANYPSGPITKSLDIVVHDAPKALFTGAVTLACQHTTLSFTDQSTTPDGTVTSVEWDMGDGTLLKDLQGKTVTHKFDAAGQYNVSSIVTNNWGCRSSSTPLPVTIRTAPEEPTFEAVKPGSCTAPFDATFINKTPDPNKEFTFTYDYGDGSTGTSPNHTYKNPGTYTVTLTATNGDCSSSKTLKNYINIGNLKASFTYSNSCQGQLVEFTNTSTPTPTSTIWTFPDNSTLNTKDAQHAIGNSGDYVVLSVSLDGCSDVTYMPITLYPQPTDKAFATPNNTCAVPAFTQFQITNSNAVSWSWDFGDGSPTSTATNPQHSYTANGVYNARVTATTAQGCKAVIPVTLDYSLPNMDIYANKMEGCVPLDVLFSSHLTSTGAETVVSYAWDFGDGTTGTGPSPAHTYTTEGNFGVTLTFTTSNGCKGTAHTQLKAGLKPVVDFSATPPVVCAKDPVQFTNLSVPRGQSWLWHFITDQDDPRTPDDERYSTEQNPLHYFRTIGKQSVELEVSNYGCKEKLLKTDIVNVTSPVAQWRTKADCDKPMERTFDDQSQWDPDPTLPRILQWDFGDGTPIVTTTNPTHTYAQQGIYKVALKVSNNICDNEFSSEIYIVNQSPTITLGQPAVCIGKSLTLTANIPEPSLQGATTIDWGDGTTTDTPSWNAPIEHMYATPGVYKIQLFTTDLNHCDKQSNMEEVTVNGPIPSFSVAGKPCRNSDITLTDNSTMNPGNQLVSWKWNFGDNTPEVTIGTAPVVTTHQYTKDGGYTIKLLVTDKYNCTAETTNFIQLDNHNASFTTSTDEPCVNDPRPYYNTSNGATKYAWDFGDGTTSSQSNPNKAFTSPGTYNVKLQITSLNGCVDEATQKIRVPDPKADFTMPEDLLPCPPANVTFTNTSVDFERSKWEFGDGTSTGNNNPDGHIYARPNVYEITLTVFTREGCSNQTKKTLTVDGPDGKAAISLDHGCAPFEPSLTANAVKTVKYAWDFDDGIVETTTTPTSPQHTYQNAGIYTPRVILTDSKGCEVPAIISGTITVDKPIADFDIDNLIPCGGGIIKFTNKSQSLTESTLGLPLTSNWDFGQPGQPGNNTTSRNPSFNYPGPGTHTIKLNITTDYGCSADISKTVTIPDQPKASINPIPDICEAGTVTISGKETLGLHNVKWTWNIGSDITNNNTTPFDYNGNLPGTIPVKLTITNADGSCPDIANAQINVHPTPLLSPTPALANVCAGSSLQLSANTDANAAVQWTNYKIDNPTSQTPLVSPDKDMTYTVIATSPFGCKIEKAVSLTVTQPFTVTTSNHTTCFGGSVQLNATGADRYTWSPATGLSRTDIPNPIASPRITTDYVVSGFDKTNCFEVKATAHVTINPKPLVDAGPDIVQSNGAIIPLHAKVSEDVTSIKWTPADNLSCSNCANPTLTPKADATYYVEVSNAYGCTNMDDINVKLVCDNANIFIPNSFSPNKDGMNDIFYIRGRGAQEVKSLKIYNRWGQLVFERYNFSTDDISKGWDGTLKGQPLPPDVYVYLAEVVCDKGGLGLLKGNITLLR
ncbi:MAG: PKD domain-containing protein [Chitinophaga sp.]|uniref:PKD domain-containing protein n=1 Tax=Chitinophaga sp. TaxID=1869181 RepID=UPI0025C1624E|nr:PKD domain-containing protein [Chitinophaga sp.]MBV8255666.1 PKD domain-containing protein [Chitinophaga sp.]